MKAVAHDMRFFFFALKHALKFGEECLTVLDQ